MGKRNNYDVKVSYDGTTNGDFELYEEYDVEVKDDKRRFRCHDVAGRNPESWDDETSSGRRINRDRVNGW